MQETAFLYPELLALLRTELGSDQDYVRNILLPKYFRTALGVREPSRELLDEIYDRYAIPQQPHRETAATPLIRFPLIDEYSRNYTALLETWTRPWVYVVLRRFDCYCFRNPYQLE